MEEILRKSTIHYSLCVFMLMLIMESVFITNINFLVFDLINIVRTDMIKPSLRVSGFLRCYFQTPL